MNNRTIAAPMVTNGRVWLVLGLTAVLLPVVYMTIVGWDSGEHGGTLIVIGLSATLVQLAIWSSVLLVARHNESITRRTAFGAGAAASLITSLVVLAATVSPAWAVMTYVGTALLTIVVVALLTSRNRGTDR